MIKRIAAVIAISVLSFASSPALAKDKAPNKKLPKVVHVCKSNDSSVDALACNMIKEAGGEGEAGMLAVGFVTLNRKMNKDTFPKTVQKVVYQRSQFSWSSGKNLKVRDRREWNKAREASKNILLLQKMPVVYRAVDPTRGALYYHKKTVSPYWSRHFIKTVRIGDHIFYKEPADDNKNKACERRGG